MAKIETDQVLTSVRRLVSDRKNDGAPDTAGPDRLVLTPALRVTDDGLPLLDPGAEEAPDSRPDAGAAEARSLAGIAGDSDARPGTPPGAGQAGEPGGKTAQPIETTLENEDALQEAASRFEAMEQAWKRELTLMRQRREAAARAPEPAAGKGASVSLEERIAQLEAAVSRVNDDWEPDGSEPEANLARGRAAFGVVDTAAPAGAGESQDGAAPRADPADRPAFRAARPPENTPPVAPVAPEGEGGDNGRPLFSHATPAPYLLSDVVSLPDAAAPSGAQAPRRAGAAGREAGREAPRHRATPGIGAGELVDDDDVYLDLDALRDMIADVVRSELRGRMGETITRNVRRMVRQEIDRAIARYDDDD